jgi:SHS2 domain-containing protein
MAPFAEIDHTADWAFRVSAPSREALFAEAAEALYTIGGVQTGPVRDQERSVLLQADDTESLFIRWLNELLFLLESESLALREIRIERLTNTELRASARAADAVEVGKYIKAATYSGLKIASADGEWRATVVLDV